MIKNDNFLIKNEFQYPRFGGSFWSQKRVSFVRFESGYFVLTAGFTGIKQYT
eukprot:UN01566